MELPIEPGPPAGLLRLATAGSVDDGKSTLIGRLLHDSRSLMADHVTAIEAASRRRGRTEIDLSLLTDGLIAEREQGITIDVAYRYFSTPARKFIIADSPGHAQYTRNMVTAASTADVAVILVDAHEGLQDQTRRHAYLSSWVGIPRVVLAVNKMDLVDWSQERFDEIALAFRRLAANLEFGEVRAIPISALLGDMVVDRGAALSWYTGPTLLEWLERAPARSAGTDGPTRLPVQRVVRVARGQGQPGSDYADREFRGYQGTLASGEVAVGDELVVLPSGQRARVSGVLVADRPGDRAHAGQAITVALDRDIDISRGDLLVGADDVPQPAREVEAELCWFDAEPLDPHRAYRIKHATRTVRARLGSPLSRIDVETLETIAPSGAADAVATLQMNDIGRIRLRAQQPLPFEPYRDQAITGAFIVVDEASNRTVAAGTVV
jgi:sulfate adenylyltransferase subunit 1